MTNRWKARTRMTINSVTHPHAYAFLNRLCTNGENKAVPEEVLTMWRSKGPEKNKLLGLFVQRCYNRDEDSSANRGRLEALIRFRQCSREFKKSMQGFSWLTEAEMKERNWSDAKVEGAKQVCLKKKMTKECPYEKVKKALVLVSDDVQKLCQTCGFLLCFVFLCRMCETFGPCAWTEPVHSFKQGKETKNCVNSRKWWRAQELNPLCFVPRACKTTCRTENSTINQSSCDHPDRISYEQFFQRPGDWRCARLERPGRWSSSSSRQKGTRWGVRKQKAYEQLVCLRLLGILYVFCLFSYCSFQVERRKHSPFQIWRGRSPRLTLSANIRSNVSFARRNSGRCKKSLTVRNLSVDRRSWGHNSRVFLYFRQKEKDQTHDKAFSFSQGWFLRKLRADLDALKKTCSLLLAHVLTFSWFNFQPGCI